MAQRGRTGGKKEERQNLCGKKRQTKAGGSSDICRVYHRIKVEIQLRKLDEKDGHRCLVYSLRMMWDVDIYSRVRIYKILSRIPINMLY